jgi:alkanesulfonate monooxygenase SsuD/methylene tetrahydromethanopterin reductase-like flavin-dependent oxidoreductase (luciferase family)
MRDSGYRLECWTQLTWLAARYPRQQLGGIVMCNSFRHPPLVAKMAATLQELSEGRCVLGYGGGWMEAEYAAYGYPYPSTRRRIEQMTEAIQVIRALWTEQPATFSGRHYQVTGVQFNPRPQPAPPIMVGGDGETRRRSTRSIPSRSSLPAHARRPGGPRDRAWSPLNRPLRVAPTIWSSIWNW